MTAESTLGVSAAWAALTERLAALKGELVKVLTERDAFLEVELPNPVDALAIRILDGQGRQLGYVPRERNEVIARLLDAGKVIFGKLEAKEWRGRWLKLDLRVFLRDV